MRGAIRVLLLPVLIRFILLSLQRACSLRKMFPTTSSNQMLMVHYIILIYFLLILFLLFCSHLCTHCFMFLFIRQYGPVRDVRIPSQEKRMFGFVSFVYPETVNIILMKRNPHYICGARVLVKPYREKSRIIDRYCTG